MAREQAHPFGALLKRFRLAKGLTQEDLAEQAGLSARAISDLERGVNHRPHQETLRCLTEALQLSEQEQGRLEEAIRRQGMAQVALASGTALPLTHASSLLVGRQREQYLLDIFLAR